MNLKISQAKLLTFVSTIFALLFNFTFFCKVFAVYPLFSSKFLFNLSLFVILINFINILLNLFCFNKILKPILYVLILLSTLAAYVMDSYGTVLDDNMFLNVFQTSSHEALDLISFKLFLYLFFLSIVPSFLLFKTTIISTSFKSEILSKLKCFSISIVLMIFFILPFGKNYASFLREHKTLRYYTNPTYFIYSVGKYAGHFIKNPNVKMEKIGTDARIIQNVTDRKLIIFVLGETARRDHFSLNGYAKDTNPLLKKEKVYSFSNMTSCGTSTAVSVPCIFSNMGRNNFNNSKAANTENLLDILTHTKQVNILWRDNNSDSKGVALRVPYEDFQLPIKNTICDPECRDVGMLVGLQSYIDSKKEGNIFIVLHQMGNHGPAYYKRYPKSFEKFKPICQTSELSNCTNEEINNAYDNATLYTDYFLSKVIELLKVNSNHFGTSMFYVSDHGESLGEKGVYLHSLPYFMAPDEQKNVAAVLWFGGHLDKNANLNILNKKIHEPVSHDNVFHTFLGLLKVNTSEFKKDLSILDGVFHN